jgi:outer membrane protein assembly factor BamB
MARWWGFCGVAGLLLCVESSPTFCVSELCSEETPAARATTIALPVSLRTTHHEINLVETATVIANEVDARFPAITLATGTSLQVRHADSLEPLGEAPLLGTIVSTSPPVRLGDGSMAEFVSREDGVVTRIHLSGSFVPIWSRSLRRAGCGTDSVSAPPVVHLRRRGTAAFKAAYVDDLVYVGTSYRSGGLAPCAGDSTQNRVVALSATDGHTVWQFNGDGLTSVDVVVGMALDRTRNVHIDPSVDVVTIRQEDTLFVTTERRASVSQNSVWAIDVITGTERWGRNSGRMVGPPILSARYEDRIYVLTRGGLIKALHKSDGSEIWSQAIGAVAMRAAAVDPGGMDPRIATVDVLGRIAMIRDNGSTVETLWNSELPMGPIPIGTSPRLPAVRAVSTPLMDDPGHVYVGASDGAIYQLDIATGEVLTSRTVDDDRTATVHELALQSPANGTDPAFMVAMSSEGHLVKYCIPFCRGSACGGIPLAADDSYTADEDTPLTAGAPGVLVNDTGAGGSPLTARLVEGPAHGFVTLNVDGSFIYAPVANFNGSDSFTYSASNGTADSGIARASITVAPLNDAPVAVDGTLTTERETPGTGVLIASDVDSPALIYAVVSNGSKGTVSIVDAATGAYQYVPNPGATGADTFTFRATDGALDSNTATVRVTIDDQTLTVVAPNGGETFLAGTTQEIRWTYSGNPGLKVRIELLKDGVMDRLIKGRAPIGAGGLGSFMWTIPVRRIEGTTYQIRITTATMSSAADTSDGEFRIIRP